MRFARRIAGSRHRAIPAILLLFAGVAALAARAGGAADTPKLEPAPAAPFHARALGGEKLDLAELRTRGPVILDFWATWCQPCVQSLPEMEKVHRRWKERGVTVIGVSVDGPRNQSRVRPFAAKLGLTFPILFDASGALQRDYQVIAIPTTVVIDTAGLVVHASQGWWPGETRKIERTIEALLGEAPAP